MLGSSPETGGVTASAAPTDDSGIQDAVDRVMARAQEFARLSPAVKAAIARECLAGLVAEAPSWVVEGARARHATRGEEWLAGPTPTIRLFRLFAESLDRIAAEGRPALGRGVTVRKDGRLEISLFPSSLLDRVTFAGFSGHALMQPGVDADAARARQASFYQDPAPAGALAVILGAGNVSSIPAMDVATKLFVEGKVCVLKMNPVNEWVGPFLERALAPLVTRGYLRILYGGADVGARLVYHPEVDDVHITGSDRTHDLIVWGPPGPERDRRRAANDPLLRVPISSELGNVSPVAIVPYTYTDDELWFMSRNLVSMVVNNASFNCNAAKVIVTARGWTQRDQFLDMVARALAIAPTRAAYYPGAFARHRMLLEGHAAELFGETDDSRLAWALVRGLDAEDPREKLFAIEPFCGIVGETSVGSGDPVEFLAAATTFMNERLWGTLNAMLLVPPALERSTAVAAALDRAIVELRYGTVGINHWPALCYAFGTMPWGGHPSATLADIQSGLGWVHNTYMLAGIEKSVIRGPLVVTPYPMWFFDNPKADAVGPLVADMEAGPSWLKLPGLLWNVLL
jgi:acyl-CoA reductase-like NAD-dependent aldehyde dehydrogenase